MINKVVKRPIPIEAVKCTKENEQDIETLLKSGVTTWEKVLNESGDTIGYNIHSWEGVDPVYYDFTKNKNSNNKPYWILKGIKGEVYPCVADDDNDAPLGYEEVKSRTLS